MKKTAYKSDLHEAMHGSARALRKVEDRCQTPDQIYLGT
jgi:hypothetical protein